MSHDEKSFPVYLNENANDGSVRNTMRVKTGIAFKSKEFSKG